MRSGSGLYGLFVCFRSAFQELKILVAWLFCLFDSCNQTRSGQPSWTWRVLFAGLSCKGLRSAEHKEVLPTSEHKEVLSFMEVLNAAQVVKASWCLLLGWCEPWRLLSLMIEQNTQAFTIGGCLPTSVHTMCCTSILHTTGALPSNFLVGACRTCWNQCSSVSLYLESQHGSFHV